MTAISAATRRAVAPVARWVDGVGSLRAIELLRIAAGPLVIAHLWPFFTDAADGIIYSDRFYQPYASWFPEMPRDAYLALLWLMVPVAVALSLGLVTRFSSIYAALFVGYNLFLSRTHFWHNRAFLFVLLVGMALLPLGRTWSVDAWLQRRQGKTKLQPVGPLWPLWLMRFEVVTVYLGSGISKLVDADWWGGTVTRLRVEQWYEVAAARGVPENVLDLLATEGFHVWFAKVAVLTEIVIALGFLYRRTRMGAIWIAVWFHVSIEIVASVQVFSAAALAALFIWVTPSARDRIVVVRGSSTPARIVRRAVRWLDWTGRFRLHAEDGPGPVIALIDRDGVTSHGAAAARMVLSRLPAVFLFVAPANLIGFRRVWDRAAAPWFNAGGSTASVSAQADGSHGGDTP